MNSRNPGPRRVWNEGPRRGRWRRFRGSAGSIGKNGRVPFCAFWVFKKCVKIVFVPPKIASKQPDVCC